MSRVAGFRHEENLRTRAALIGNLLQAGDVECMDTLRRREFVHVAQVFFQECEHVSAGRIVNFNLHGNTAECAAGRQRPPAVALASTAAVCCGDAC